MLPMDEGLLIDGCKSIGSECASQVFSISMVMFSFSGRLRICKAFRRLPATQGGCCFAENANTMAYMCLICLATQKRNLIMCRRIDEEDDGSLACMGEMHVLTPDYRVREKLFVLHFPQQIMREEPAFRQEMGSHIKITERKTAAPSRISCHSEIPKNAPASRF